MKSRIFFNRLFWLIIISVNPWPATAQYITTFAGDGLFTISGDGGPATAAGIARPDGIAADSAGNVYFFNGGGLVMRYINPAGIINIFAGNGIAGFSGDGGPATAAEIYASEQSIGVDRRGNVYFADNYNNRIRKVNNSGIITTIAGNGVFGYTGDGGPATAAALRVTWLTADRYGNVYFPDTACVRKVDTAGIISTIAGTTYGYSGDGGAATAAQLSGVKGIAVDLAGNLFLSDFANFRIREIDTHGIINTIAGTGVAGYSGDSGPATNAKIYNVWGLLADASGNLYFCDIVNQRIRKINASGIVTTIAGTGVSGFWGDGRATAAQLFDPYNIARYGNGNIYISDSYNDRIRMIVTAPYFVNGPVQAVTLCNGTFNVDTLLAANDSNSGNTETWSLVSGPFHGTASVGYTAISTGNVIIPAGLTYTPMSGYSGADTFSVWISDGVISDTTTVYLTVQEPAHAGAITGPDTVCKSKSITLSDTASGGAWSGSNTHAFVSGAGSISGTSPGTDTISYTVTNSCGAVRATYIVTIEPCTNEVSTLTASDGIKIFPNPGDGTFTLTFSSSINEQAQVAITNLVGEKVKEFTISSNNETNINLDAPAGIYFLSAVTGEGSFNAKVVVVK